MKADFIKKFITPLGVMLILEAAAIILAAAGLIPREAVLFWTGLAVFYLLFAPASDALWLVVASIPFYAALPISDNFDAMANWRILILILFCRFVWEKRIFAGLVKDGKGKIIWGRFLKEYSVELCFIIFLLASLPSFWVAPYKILAVKKLLFFGNAFLIFLIVKGAINNQKGIFEIWRAAAVGGLVVLAASLVQFFWVLSAPLHSFWQSWASKVIPVFYGNSLAHLLSYSNTWFAYYSASPPTLRLFSFFPDSHSFAMFNLLILPILAALAMAAAGRQAKLFWRAAAILSFAGIVLSGSRGAWLSAAPVLAAALFVYFKNVEKELPKKVLGGLGIFILIFILSTGYPSLLYKFQARQGSGDSTAVFNFFERAKSISDLDEVSNKGRLEIWRAGFESLMKHPWRGVGLGNYIVVLDEDMTAVKKGASAHNLYLDLAAEVGLFGAACFAGIFAVLLRVSWLVWRDSREIYFKFFGLLFGLYLIWILSYSFFDVVLLNDKVFLLFWVSAAVLNILKNLGVNQKEWKSL